MIEVNLYNLSILIVGALVVTIIDRGLGIEWNCSFWKQFTHKVTYMAWGGVIVTLF